VQHDDESDADRNVRTLVAQLSALLTDDKDVCMQSEIPSDNDNPSKIGPSNPSGPAPECTKLDQGPPIVNTQDLHLESDDYPLPTYKYVPAHPKGDGVSSNGMYFSDGAFVHIAAARIDDPPKDREFRSAQHRNYPIRE
jgi:hypothetical protein